ncbi:MAG: hypothetical protein ABWY93_18260 [Mycobacterium sp.]
MNQSSTARRIGRGVSATVLAAAGLVIGWLVVKGVLALPLPETALFGLSGLGALAFLAGAVLWKQLWGRALLIGGCTGVVLALLLVLLVVG